MRLSPGILKEFERLSDDELEKKYKSWAKDEDKHDALILLREELLLREQRRYNAQLKSYTRQITILTWVIAFLTVVITLLTYTNLCVS